MGRYLIRRTLQLALTLWVVSVVTFLIFVKLPPGDPALRLAGKVPSPELMAQIRERIGLDDPLVTQYLRFAKGFVPVPGWFLNEQVYYSWKDRVPVNAQLEKRFPYSVALALGGTVLWLLMGVPLGILSAVRRGGALERTTMGLALVGISVPGFWLAMVLIFVFYFQLGVAPPIGVRIGDTVWSTMMSGKLILPWFSIAITNAAIYARLVRGSMLEILGEDYVRTARAKGLRERVVVYRHMLRASLVPVVTTLGLDLGYLLSGATLTERIFAIPGVGVYALDAIGDANFPGVMAVTVIGALFVIFANLVVDVLYAVLDPRVRYD